MLQIAYVKVLDGRARFDGGSAFKTWLFAVIRRTAAERRRGRWMRSLTLARWRTGRGEPEPSTDPEALASSAEAARSLRDSLRALPTRQRELLHLVFYEDLSLEEAALVVGISVGTARTHYHRGKARLRALLAARGTMTMRDDGQDDADLRQAFAVLRREEAKGAPTFEAVRARGAPSPSRARWAACWRRPPWPLPSWGSSCAARPAAAHGRDGGVDRAHGLPAGHTGTRDPPDGPPSSGVFTKPRSVSP